MTNEEAAKRIKQGDKAAEVTLWQNVLGIIRLYAYRWCRAKAVLCARAGVTLEDLIQEGYFAMLEAVSAYDETRAICSIPISNIIYTTLFGGLVVCGHQDG